MEYVTISAKVSRVELTELKAYCDKRNITTSTLLRNLLRKELDSPLPANLSGRNQIIYNAKGDNFTWQIVLDNDDVIKVMDDVPTEYVQNLKDAIDSALKKRDETTRRTKKCSVPVPSEIVRGEKK
ncbi:MAG: hypothetical protein Q7J68_06215 [Thermoplasmata archaeon]|nr:hypothetical protein [Thermoplasmata archaeon]